MVGQIVLAVLRATIAACHVVQKKINVFSVPM